MSEKYFALYQGDEFIDLGTLDELSRKFNMKKTTLLFYSTKSYKKRIAKRKKKLKNCKILIRIEDY